MTSDIMIRDMFRSLEATIRERLSMIEDVIIMGRGKRVDEGDDGLSAKMTTVLEAIQTIDARLTNLELKKADNSAETVHVNHIGKMSPDIWTVNAMPGLEIHLNDPPGKDFTIPIVENVDVDIIEDEEEDMGSEVEEEADEEEADEEEVAEEADEEEVAEEADEEEGEAVEQFEYKGKNYYRDSSNQVYAENEDGDPDDTVIGVWNQDRQRVLFKRV